MAGTRAITSHCPAPVSSSDDLNGDSRSSQDYLPSRTGSESSTINARDSNGNVNSFVVMSWNVLADGAAQYEYEQRTGDCDLSVVGWTSRSLLLVMEIEKVSPDILLLSECNHFEDFWCKQLQRLGLKGLFAPRYDEAAGIWPVPDEYCGAPSDGCAIFYRERCFDLIWSETFRFQDFAAEVAQHALLAPRGMKLPNLLVGAVHFKDGNDPACAEQRKLQSRIWAKRLEDKLEEVGTQVGCGIELVLAGDFNEPLEPTEAFEYVGGAAQSLQEAFGIISVYHDAEPPVTATWGKQFHCTTDFIFHSGGLRASELLSMPSVEEVLNSGADGVPSLSYPSDHISLAARLICDTGTHL